MTGMGARQATADYLGWLGAWIPLVAADLAAKAKAMAADPLRFLRGSYYLWLLRAAEEIPELLAAPLVVAVGDAHVENFGIWTDDRGQRVWGVNDFDEVGLSPYTLDLVRMVASAIVSTQLDRGLRLQPPALSELVLEGWAQGVGDPGALLLDGPEHPHLRALAPTVDAGRFWRRLDEAPAVPDPVPAIPAEMVVAEGMARPDWRRRVAGTGSLGHRRMLALGPMAGSRGALETKELGPPTVDWPPLSGVTDGWRNSDGRAWAAVSRMPGFPAGSRRREGWALRRLGPESARIELTAMNRRRDESALVRSMGRALGAVHAAGGERVDEARRHAEHWTDLQGAAQAMAARVGHDFRHAD